MKILLDEMHAPAVAVELRARGYDAVAVKERPELVGLADADLLTAATRDRRAVVTENIKDFAILHHRLTAAGAQHAGLVFTHQRRFPRAARNHVDVLSQALTLFIETQSTTFRDVESFVWWLDRPVTE